MAFKSYKDTKDGTKIVSKEFRKRGLFEPAEHVLLSGENDPTSNIVIDKTTGLRKDYSPGPGKEKATFVSVINNSDLWSIIASIRQIEDRFNRKYNYDWVFLTTGKLNDKFKKQVSLLCSGTAKFGEIDNKSQWSYPDWIDVNKAVKAAENMRNNRIIYGDSEKFRHKSRFLAGFFFKHPLMAGYDWYWRVDLKTKIYCDIEYDIFKFMRENNKKFSFTVSIPEYEDTIPTLWDSTKNFLQSNKELMVDDNLIEFISDDNGDSFNKCTFWTNFQIGSLDFWRDDAYTKYFEFIDNIGGIYYERWSEAPIQTIAASLFLSKKEIHFFDDIGYYNIPFYSCPIDETIRTKNKCMCAQSDDFTWKGYSCTPHYFDVNGLKRPANWKQYSS